jgi:hypothetical protein
VIHAYAFAAAPAVEVAGVEARGVEDAPVEVVASGALAAVVSRHATQPVPTEASVLRHAAVVDAALAAVGAVVPARFGVHFGGDDALDRALAEHAGALGEQLRRVRGCVELGLRLLASAEPERPTGSSGADYLRERLRESNERRRRALAFHEPLHALARESSHSIPATGRVLLRASYLVPAGGQAAFATQVHELERGQPDVTALFTGPWPPYSFASADGELG